MPNPSQFTSPIEWKDGIVRMLDQSRLPAETVYIECKDAETVAKGIIKLWIRGAPAIGVAGAMGLALAAQTIPADNFQDFKQRLQPVFKLLSSTRPTAVNLFWALDRMEVLIDKLKDKPVDEIRKRLVSAAIELHREIGVQDQAIGRHGAELIPDQSGILTHCNTGALATGGIGTALGVLFTAWENGKRFTVFADETRPMLQGARLTMWELKNFGIPSVLITDNMAGALMKEGKIQACIVGADRIAANGDTANKIGTYSLAVLARAHGIPFYVAAPTSTVDLSTESGEAIPIEKRNSDEVTTVLGKVRIAPDNVEVANPAFDVTPAELITAIVTEKGILKPGDLKNKIKDRHF